MRSRDELLDRLAIITAEQRQLRAEAERIERRQDELEAESVQTRSVLRDLERSEIENRIERSS